VGTMGSPSLTVNAALKPYVDGIRRSSRIARRDDPRPFEDDAANVKPDMMHVLRHAPTLPCTCFAV
jgi:hypothetical protein